MTEDNILSVTFNHMVFSSHNLDLQLVWTHKVVSTGDFASNDSSITSQLASEKFVDETQ